MVTEKGTMRDKGTIIAQLACKLIDYTPFGRTAFRRKVHNDRIRAKTFLIENSVKVWYVRVTDVIFSGIKKTTSISR